jgi:hypothetical protein
MKFRVTYLEERTSEIDVTDIGEAEAYGVSMMGRLGGFPTARLLSVLPIMFTDTSDKPPTPFGAPPSGTLGGGQVKAPGALPDAYARVA